MLTNVTAFYDKMNGSVDERRAVSVIYLHFNMAFDVMSHNMHASKLECYDLCGGTTMHKKIIG